MTIREFTRIPEVNYHSIILVDQLNQQLRANGGTAFSSFRKKKRTHQKQKGTH
jgi:hypothetical protein